MSATTEPTLQVLKRIQQAEHPFCVVCGQSNEQGLGLSFFLRGDGSVEARFECKPHLQGYDGLLHGGVIASLMDGAMTNCLFAHGIVAVTVEMTVRFRHPIVVDDPLVVKARITYSQPPLYVVAAEIVQNGQVKAKTNGKFMQRPILGLHRPDSLTPFGRSVEEKKGY